MKPAPSGWSRISTTLFYEDARTAIDFLCRAFGFEVKLLVEHDGKVVHSQLLYGDGVVMAGQLSGRPDRLWCAAPGQTGGRNTQSLFVYVDDADAHCAVARREGAVIASEPTTVDYGPDHWADRGYEAVDCEGHHWWFAHRVR
jgi:uncharacterized glyoxalase superfamily protein PhnB